MSLKYLDENGLIYYHSLIKDKINTKVDKAFKTGSETAYKVLSDNNFSDELLTKVNNIAENAQVNVLEGIQKNGVDLEIQNKKVNIIVPTKLGELTNDKNYVIDTNYIHTDNNFTDLLLTKLNDIEENAQSNKIDIIKVNGVVQEIQEKTVDISVPIKVGQLSNDKEYQTKEEVNTAIRGALSDISGISFYRCQPDEFDSETGVPTLASGEIGTIYLTPINSLVANNAYNEWFWDTENQAFEKMGTTEVDLTNYVSFDDLIAITNSEIDNIVAI